MSIPLATGPGALVALGLGVGDVTGLISLGHRFGKGWTAPSGDADLLSDLNEDPSSVINRRGLLDILAFNKWWRKQIRLLGNGRPVCIQKNEMKEVLGDVGQLIPVSLAPSYELSDIIKF
jgi:hypothetical protein